MVTMYVGRVYSGSLWGHRCLSFPSVKHVCPMGQEDIDILEAYVFVMVCLNMKVPKIQ
jgi:hypothetical protein